MKNPPHPGNWSATILKRLGVDNGRREGARISRQQLHNVIAGRYGITPEMDMRLEKALGSTADTWLGMQMNYDLAQIQAKASSLKVTRLARLDQLSLSRGS